jgi:glucose-6-phosphate 1-dehydrogenase
MNSGPRSVTQAAEPCAIVLFGASGDLARRKVVPALYDLAAHEGLAERYAIVGFARTAMTEDAFRTGAGVAARTISEVGPIDDAKWAAFAKSLAYVSGAYDDDAAYTKLAAGLTQLDRAQNLQGNRLFYLATPPEIYPQIIGQLGRAGLARAAGRNSWARIIIEKPYGRDLASARKLNQQVLEVFDESQV